MFHSKSVKNFGHIVQLNKSAGVPRKIYSLFALVLLGATACSKKDNSQSPTPEYSAGAKIVKANCKVCHAQGINGAPIIGNKKMWSKRLDKGIPELITNASNGVGLMPAKGGNAQLTQEEIAVAVNFMIEQLN